MDYKRTKTSSSFKAPAWADPPVHAYCSLCEAWPSSEPITTGVEFWKRTLKRLNANEVREFRAKTKKDYANRLKHMRLMPQATGTHVVWDGKDFLVKGDERVPYIDAVAASRGYFSVTVPIAKQWVFLNATSDALGRNVTFEPPKQEITREWVTILQECEEQRTNSARVSPLTVALKRPMCGVLEMDGSTSPDP